MTVLMKRGRLANLSAARYCLAVMLGCLLVLALKPMTLQKTPEGEAQKDKTLSPYFVVLGADTAMDTLPLKSTQADVKIAGKVADVTVTQVYKNQGKKALEAIYVFPGSTRAAVHALSMTVGDRVIEAKIMERQRPGKPMKTPKKRARPPLFWSSSAPMSFR